jgi:hypothetical protein
MPRRKRTAPGDYAFSAMTLLFAWLVAVSAVAGLIGEVVR